MNEKPMFEPLCWMIVQYDHFSEKTLRSIVLERPPEEDEMIDQVRPIHFLPQEFLDVLLNKKG